MSREAFLDAMAAAVAGVTVVTTLGDRGPIGRTISAMTSVSADPPLLLVCINRASPLRDAVLAHEAFAVNVLASHQAAVADAFAGRTGDYGFDTRLWTPSTGGIPLLDGAAATFDCVIEDVTEAGSHTVVVGVVVASRAGAAAPLAYSRRGYATAAPLPGMGLAAAA